MSHPRGASLIVVRVLGCAVLGLATMAGCSGEEGATTSTTSAPVPSVFSLADGTRAGFAQPAGLAVSRDGRRLYFTARRIQDDAPAVYQLDLGNQTVTQLFAGAPLVEPGPLAVTADARSLLITDLAAGSGDTSGTVFKMPITGSLAPASVLAPGAIDLPGGIAIDHAGQRVFVSGYTREGVPAIFSMNPEGNGLSVVAQGDPFSDPAALAVTHDQHALLVVDTAADLDGTATVFRVRFADGVVEPLATGLPAGYPAGITTDNSGSEAFLTARTSTGRPAILGVTTGQKVVRTVATTDAQSCLSALVQSPVSPFVLYLADADGPGGTGNILTVFR